MSLTTEIPSKNLDFITYRHSELLLEAGVLLLTKYFSSIDDSSNELLLTLLDLYLIEESFYSALDVKQLDWANMFLKVLINKFPQSPKVLRMLGMLHEAL